MENNATFREFSEKIPGSLDTGRMMQDIEYFSHLHRYSGSKDGETAAEYIAARMETLGIPVSREIYPIYRSLPGDACLKFSMAKEEKVYPLTPYVYSGGADNLEGELVFDEISLSGCCQKDMKKRMEAFRGKLILTYESSFEFACAAKAAGALGILTIWQTDLAHHGTLGGVWGSPEPEDLEYHYPRIPFAEVLKSHGEALRAAIENNGGTLPVSLTVHMEDGILNSMMPVATIKGKSEKMILVSGHYDSWYEGVTDNGVANAAMMEMARVFKENEDSLQRTVVFAWWSGHSDGRYSGSTWYFDHHWMELHKNCVAHLNMDICGCMGSDLVGFNTSMLEGAKFCHDFLKEFNEEEPIPPVPMARFADQTFWGAGVPFAIMPKFSKSGKKKLPFYWWHTKEDTIDKIDPAIVLRDAKVIAKLAAVFANTGKLPAQIEEFAALMEKRLCEIAAGLSEDFCLQPVIEKFPRLKEVLKEFELMTDEKAKRGQETDEEIVKISGELVRITYTAGSPYHQDPAIDGSMFPALSKAIGLNRENTEADYYLAMRTRFVRQRNRLAGQIERTIDDCMKLLAQWEG